MKSLKTLTICATLLASGAAMAIPASPNPVRLRNGDGTTVTARLRGDEHLLWAEDLDGWPLAFDEQKQAWHYAVRGPDGLLKPLRHRAGAVDPATLGLTRHLTPSDEAVAAALDKHKRSFVPNPPALTGSIKALTILVKFANHSTKFGPSNYSTLLNGSTNSFKHYYQQVSGGKVSIDTTIAMNQWVPLSRNNSYYAENSPAMVREAVQWLDSRGFDFRPYRHPTYGLILDIIHSGEGREFSGSSYDIHSHFADLTWYGMAFSTDDGVAVTKYHTEPEFRDDAHNITMLGVVTHETAHFFGLPDLYDYSNRSAGVGAWSLMAAGSWGGPNYDGTVPSFMDAWSRMKLGLISPTTVSATTADVKLGPAETTHAAVKLGAGMPATQYFLLENRQRTSYDTYLPAAGLAIWHVDDARWQDPCTQGDCNNNLFNAGAHYLVDLEQADGRRELNTDPYEWGNEGDLWPYRTATGFGPATTPNSKAYGYTASKIGVWSITRSGSDVLFDVEVSGTSTRLPLGSDCTGGVYCDSGFCSDGKCCDKACNVGSCDVCAKARGATADGRCTPLNAGGCNDGNACTTNDVCSGGVCKGTTKSCPQPSNPCQQAGTCNTNTGNCSAITDKADESSCDDGDGCTRTDYCVSGKCVGTQKVTCKPAACQKVTACTEAGKCVFGAAEDGTSCDDGNPCTESDSCASGQCRGTEKACAAAECQVGVCDPNNGGNCGTAPAADGTPCTGGTCQAGACESTSCLGCSAGAQTAGLAVIALLSLPLIRRRRR